MAIAPSILFGKVMHGRLFPKQNRFSYRIYYLALPLSTLSTLPLAYNRFAPLSFFDRDHGDGGRLETWARTILTDYGVHDCHALTLICMPRVLGYVFNPVSFWLCHNREGQLLSVLCEVHNTFGERHTYLCATDNGDPITSHALLKSQKVFHVSPMLPREGHYEFRFAISADRFAVWINYFDHQAHKQLVTTLSGKFAPLSRSTLRRAFWLYPLVTLKAITLIHWQALKLLIKSVPFFRKPQQKTERVTATGSLTKTSNPAQTTPCLD